MLLPPPHRKSLSRPLFGWGWFESLHIRTLLGRVHILLIKIIIILLLEVLKLTYQNKDE